MAKLTPWYNVDGCRPREDLRQNRPFDAAEFAVNLDHIRNGDATDDYKKPELFFERTFLTAPLKELCAQVVRRLAGETNETSAIFNMATQFGGGKTHALASLMHLAKGGQKARKWRGVETILSKAEVDTVPDSAVAAFVGTEFDALKGREGAGEPKRLTPWGEIAWQLGGEKSFKVVMDHDAKGVAPAGDVIRKMLPAKPSLILIDEVVNYLGNARKTGHRESMYNFMQNLQEVASGTKGLVVCASIPKSELTEMTPEDEADYSRFKHLMERKGKAVLMSADTEIAEIIRRRLFEWKGMPEEGKKAAQVYAEWVNDNRGALAGSALDTENAYELFLSCYPFHPCLLAVFQRKWQTLPRFQRTRGVLRLLAHWVGRNFQEDHQVGYPDTLIELGSAPLDYQHFRTALFEQLGEDKLDTPATVDIEGNENAHAVRLDKESTAEVRKQRLHKKVAATVLFESNGGQTKDMATVGEIRAAVGGPGVNQSNVDGVLETLSNTCYYMAVDKNRYKFGLTPNVNKIFSDRRSAITAKAIVEQLESAIEEQFTEKLKDVDYVRYFAPALTNAVPDQARLTLIVWGPQDTANDPGLAARMDEFIKNCGNSHRTFKTALVFSFCDNIGGMESAARDALAWEAVNEDSDTMKRLDDPQRKHVKEALERARKDLRNAVFRSYKFAACLGKEGALKRHDMGHLTPSMGTSLSQIIFSYLQQNEEAVDGVSPARIVKSWPPTKEHWNTRSVRDAFFSTPKLPRLLKGDSIKRTIVDGVAKGDLGYCSVNADGSASLLKFKESIDEFEIELSEDFAVVRSETAQKLKEPPKLARLEIIPTSATVQVGKQHQFQVDGYDQYDRPFDPGKRVWKAAGGTITESGLFTAGGAAGAAEVSVAAGGIAATCPISVVERAEPAPPHQPSAQKTIQWSGDVPAQKWNQFYMKVLVKLAQAPGLKLNVKLEAQGSAAVDQAKLDDVRAGLKELGLGDDVTIK